MSDSTTNEDSDQKAAPAVDRITILLPIEVGRALRARAEREVTPVTVLIRRWIVERLRADEPR